MAERARNARVMRRPRNVDRTLRRGSEQSVGVFENQRVFGFNQRSSVPQFLDNLAEKFHEHGVSEIQETAAEDAATGEISDELEDNHLYRETVAKARGNTDAIGKLKFIEQDLPRAIREARENGEEFNVDEYIEQQFEDLEQSASVDEESYLQAVRAVRLEARSLVAGNAEALESGLLLEEAQDAFDGQVFQRFQEGNVSEDSIRALRQQGDELGLTKNEINDRLLSGALTAMDGAATQEEIENVHSTITDYLEKNDKGFLGRNAAEIRKVKDAAITRLARDANQLTLEEQQEQNDTILRLQDRIRRPRDRDLPSHTLLSENREVIGEAAYKRLSEELSQAYHDQWEESKEALEVQEQENVFRQVREQGTAAYRSLDSEDQDDYVDWLEQETERTSRAILGMSNQLQQADTHEERLRVRERIAAALSGEAEDMPEGIDFMGLVEDFAATGETPRVLEQMFSNSNVNSPSFASDAMMYQMLRSRLMENGERVRNVFPEVPAAAQDAFQEFNDLVFNQRFSPDDAIEYMNRFEADEQTAAQRRAQLLSDNRSERKMELTISDLAGESNNRGYVTSTLTDLASTFYSTRTTRNPDWAIQKAREHFENSHINIDGTWVPSRGIPDGFDQVFAANRDRIQKSLEDSEIPMGDSGFVVAPVQSTGLTGRLQLLDAEFGTPLRTDEGRALFIDPMEMTVKTAEEAKANSREELIEYIENNADAAQRAHEGQAQRTRQRQGVQPNEQAEDTVRFRSRARKRQRAALRNLFKTVFGSEEPTD